MRQTHAPRHRRTLWIGVALLVLLAPLRASAETKTWSGTIKYVTYSDVAQPMDPASPFNGVFIYAIDVSGHDDGRYTLQVTTDPLNALPTFGPLMRVMVQVGDIRLALGDAKATNNWTFNGCIKKDSKWLRVAPVGHFNMQLDVKVNIKAVHGTTRCDLGA